MTIKFKGFNCILATGRYPNGRLALRLVDAEDGGPIATASVNLPDEECGPDEVFVKSYAENEGLLEVLKDHGIVEPTGRVAVTGYVTAPCCKVRGV